MAKNNYGIFSLLDDITKYADSVQRRNQRLAAQQEKERKAMQKLLQAKKIENLKIQVEKENKILTKNYNNILHILKELPEVNPNFIFEYYKKQLQEIPDYNYISKLKVPTLNKELELLEVKEENKILEFFYKKRKNERIKLTQQANDNYLKKYQEYIALDNKLKKQYYINAIINILKTKVHNDLIMNEYRNYQDDKNVIAKLIKEYLSQYAFKFKIDKIKDFAKYYKCEYNQSKKLFYSEINFISPKELNKLKKKAKYNNAKKQIEYQNYSDNEINIIYENIIMQGTLKIISDLFSIFKECIDDVIVNCLVTDINPLNGIKEEINIFSIKLNKNAFNNVNIKNVDINKFLEKNHVKYNKKMIELHSVKKISVSNEKEDNEVKEAYEKNTIENIDNNLDGFEFEFYSKELLLANGFENVEVTKASGDFGADVIAWKDEIKYAIQCKKFSGSVGIKAVQEVIGSMGIYNCHVGVVLTNSYFTPSAIELAKNKNIILWDRNKLKEMVEIAKQKESK